jgi:hypothetical protein
VPRTVIGSETSVEEPNCDDTLIYLSFVVVEMKGTNWWSVAHLRHMHVSINLFRPEPVTEGRFEESFEELKSTMLLRRQIEGRKGGA